MSSICGICFRLVSVAYPILNAGEYLDVIVANRPFFSVGGLASEDMTKPEIDFPDGPPPSELVIEDLVVGDGAEAVPGGNVEVHYLGVEYDTGEEFDSSWNRGQTIEFPLRGLIQGWQDGIPGMKVGGRRKLVIPPALAYGPAGSGHRLSGKTLIFVIDLVGTR
jgi:peptidylprolyl isomerase